MIRYELRCKREHRFEAWFRNAADYDRQRDDEAISCPVCGSLQVSKAIMAPALAAGRHGPDGPESPAALPLLAEPDPERAAVIEMLRHMHEQVKQNADYVGDRFPEEARRIHYGEVEPHGIYGEATAEEAKALADEGIEFQPLPVPPEDRN